MWKWKIPLLQSMHIVIPLLPPIRKKYLIKMVIQMWGIGFLTFFDIHIDGYLYDIYNEAWIYRNGGD